MSLVNQLDLGNRVTPANMVGSSSSVASGRLAPVSMSGCVLWLTAGLNDDPVSLWRDASSHGNNAVQSTGSLQPTWGNGVMSFDGTEHMEVAAGSDFDFGTADFTISFFMRSSSSSRQHAIDFGTAGVKNISFDFNDAGYGIFLYWNSAGTNRIVSGSTGDYTDGSWRRFIFKRESGAVDFRVDNVSMGTLSGTGNTSMGDATNNVQIGRRITSSHFPLNGDLDQIAVFNRALSEIELEKMHRWIR